MPNPALQSPTSDELARVAKSRLKEEYLTDGRPWVVAYSGGKDSTLVLHLVYEMLIELGTEAVKPVFVISSDTRVEAPTVVSYVENALSAVEKDATERKLPVSCHLVRPELEETYWSKLIGKGYPPPTRWFRWCTTNMKIKPCRREIARIVADRGSVILLLGTRTAESSNRKRAMEARLTNSRDLNLHHEIPNAFVLTPISTWGNDDVWEYLFENNPPPWKRSHDQMLSLYRQALGGECPVVMDLNTPSCGGSRFGCWTCTVVKRDKSMEGFIASGEEWMRPLAEFRNWLKIYREDPEARMTHRRDGSKGAGPFTPTARQNILRKLLETEKKVDMQLVSDEEIQYIQTVWNRDFDLQDCALNIAGEFDRLIPGGSSMPLEEDEKLILEDIVARQGINPDLVDKVLALETDFPNLGKWGARAVLNRKIKELISVSVTQANNQA